MHLFHQARSLENQIDSKLIELSKFGTHLKGADFSSKSSKTPLLADTDDLTEDDFAKLTGEVDWLLNRLASVNASLSDWTDQHPASAATQHTLQRHREILKDYKQEYIQTKNNISALIKRNDLLFDRSGGSSSRSGDYSSSNLRMDLLLKESEHARNSERLIDDQISIAIEARDSLVNQRVAFKAIQTKLNDISNRFPIINNLVQRINLRKRRDAIIVAVVIGLCLAALLWWMTL